MTMADSGGSDRDKPLEELGFEDLDPLLQEHLMESIERNREALEKLAEM